MSYMSSLPGSWGSSGAARDYGDISAECDGIIDEGEPTERPCGWEGDTEAYYYSTTRVWVCPRCGYEHEQDLEDLHDY